jgi:hypothetical protein
MVRLNLKAWNFLAAALVDEEPAPVLAAEGFPGMPALLTERFEFIMLEIAIEVEGKCCYIVFYWR